MRRTILIFTTLGLSAVAVVLGIYAGISWSVRGMTTTVADAEPATAAIVLGARVHEDGQPSDMLEDRVQVAADLYAAGKVDRIIVSGDHGTVEYDEPRAMRSSLMEKGVPKDAIFGDHAGFDTRASMVRAKQVFGVDRAIVVTQGFHLPRALYLAKAADLDAQGVSADLRNYGAHTSRGIVREYPARVKAMAELVSARDVLLGPPVPIMGDAALSWEPE